MPDVCTFVITGGLLAPTVTVVWAVALPELFVAVRVYVVVTVGLTEVEPFVATEPTDEIDTDVAPLVVQESVAD